MAAAGVVGGGLIPTVVNTIQGIARQRNVCLEAVKQKASALGSAILYSSDYFSALRSLGTPQAKKRIEEMKQKDLFFFGVLSPKYWERVNDERFAKFQIKKGVNPNDALDSVYSDDRAKMGLSLLDCAASSLVAYYHGIRAALGREKFAAIFAADSSTPLNLDPQDTRCSIFPFLRVKDPNKDALQPGDMVTIWGVFIYGFRHFGTGASGAYTGICIDAPAPGREKITTLGLSPDGETLAEVKTRMLNEFNEPPLKAADLYSKSCAEGVEAKRREKITELLEGTQKRSGKRFDITPEIIDLFINLYKTQIYSEELMNSPALADSAGQWGKIRIILCLNEQFISALADLKLSPLEAREAVHQRFMAGQKRLQEASVTP